MDKPKLTLAKGDYTDVIYIANRPEEILQPVYEVTETHAICMPMDYTGDDVPDGYGPTNMDAREQLQVVAIFCQEPEGFAPFRIPSLHPTRIYYLNMAKVRHIGGGRVGIRVQDNETVCEYDRILQDMIALDQSDIKIFNEKFIKLQEELTLEVFNILGDRPPAKEKPKTQSKAKTSKSRPKKVVK